MTKPKVKKFWSSDYWIKETFHGGFEYRTSSKVLFTVLPILIAVLLYKALIVIEGLESGAEIIMILAYGIGILMITLILLVLIISLIEYLRTFE
jgi:hypothetical protein